MKLDRQRVVVIGGSSGIGLGITRALAANGARLILTGRTARTLEAAKAAHPNVEAVAAFDFTDEWAVETFFASTGPIDHLVLVAAGSPRTRPFLEKGALSDIGDYLQQKLWGVLYTAHHGIPRIRRGGSIVFFIGGAGRRAIPGTAPLAVVNTATVGLAKTVAAEIKPTRVNVVCPGVVDTGCWDYMGEPGKRAFLDSCASGNPLGRLGTPDDVAEAVLFLLGSDYVNGVVLDVVGGETVDFMH